MDTSALQRLDSFPYRHRLGELMRSPVAAAPPALSLPEAARRMDELGVSSLLVGEGDHLSGIVTERDILRATARLGADFAVTRLDQVMSAPLLSLPAEAFVYRALGLMARAGIRHMPVSDRQGRIVGIVTARTLLRQRAGGALALGDRIDGAADAAELAAAWGELPALAQNLLHEQATALQVAGVISAVLRDVTARAAALAEAAVSARLGPAPSLWCVMVLGSGGRGESLLGADQDNAIIHQGGDDAWFAAVGKHIADTLNATGIPYCKGAIMAANPPWRGSLADWQQRIEHWIRASDGRALLNVDIFYDCRGVSGALALAEDLRRGAVAAASKSLPFLRLLAESAGEIAPGLGLFGRFITDAGRIDLKRGGLLPLVSGARVMALKQGIAATATDERLEAAAAAGRLGPDDLANLLSAHELLLGLILRQQIADLAAGTSPSNRVELKRLDRQTRERLRAALHALGGMRLLLQDALSA